MIEISKNGTRLDLEIRFIQLRLKVNFECSVSMYVLTNTKKVESESAIFDVASTRYIGDVKKTVNTSIILFPHKKNIVEINFLLLTQKGKKCAGVVTFDVDEALKSKKSNFVIPLEKCPDPNAKVSFQFTYSNPTNIDALEVPGERKKTGLNTTNVSFYSHLNNEDTSFNKNVSNDTSNISLNIRNLARNRSRSPGGAVKLNFNAQRARPVSKAEFTQPAKEFTIDSPRKESKPNIFDNYYKEDKDKDKAKNEDEGTEKVTQYTTKLNGKDTNNNLEKKFKDLEDNFMIINKENNRLKTTNNELKTELDAYKNMKDKNIEEKNDNKLLAEMEKLKSDLDNKEEALFAIKLELEQTETKLIEYKRQTEVQTSELEKKEKYLKQKNDELEEENYILDEKYSDAKQKVYELETVLEQFKEEQSRQLDNIKGIQNKNQISKNEYDALKEENQKLTVKLKTLKNKNADLQFQLDTVKEEKVEWEESNAKDGSKVEELQHELDVLRKKLAAKEEELIDAQEKNIQQKEEYDQILRQKENEINNLAKNSKSESGNDLKERVSRLQNKLEEKDEEIIRLKSKIETLEITLDNPANDKTQFESTIYNLEKKLTQKEFELEEQKRSNETLKEEYEGRIAVATKKLKRSETQYNEVAEQQKELAQKEVELKNIKDDNRSKEVIIKELKDKIASLETSKLNVKNTDNDELEGYHAQINQLKDKNSKLLELEKEKNKEIEDLKAKIDRFEQDVDGKKNENDDIDYLKTEKKELEAKLAKLQDQQSANEELKQELSEHKKKKKELEGLVADLKKQIASNQNKGLYESDDLTVVTVENENLKRKVKLLELRLQDAQNTKDLENKYKNREAELQQKLKEVEKHNMEIQQRLEKASKDGAKGQGIDRNEYAKLEKNYVDSMKKIGDVLMIVQSLKLKKEDKDRIIGTLVS